MLDATDDNYLLESLLNKNEKGILEIYKKLFPKIRNYIKSKGGNEDDAKDVMQKALMQISARLEVSEFKISTNFEGYLFITCKNLWLRELKIKKTRVTNDNLIHLVTEEEDIAQAALEQDKWELFQEKLQGLSENCRKILALFFKKIPYKQIAEELGYGTENVVKQRIFKCKTKIKEAVQSDSRYIEIKG